MPWIEPKNPRDMTPEEFKEWEIDNKEFARPDKLGYMDDRLVDLLLDIRELLTEAREAGRPVQRASELAHRLNLDAQRLGMRLRTAGFGLVPALELRHLETGATLDEAEAAKRIRRASQREFLPEDLAFIHDEQQRTAHLRRRTW